MRSATVRKALSPHSGTVRQVPAVRKGLLWEVYLFCGWLRKIPPRDDGDGVSILHICLIQGIIYSLVAPAQQLPQMENVRICVGAQSPLPHLLIFQT